MKIKQVKNLTKHVHDLYTENYTMLLKKIKKNLSKYRDLPYLWKTT